MIYIEISVCGSCIFYHPKYLSPSPHQGSNPNPSPAFRPAMQPQSSTDPASKRQWQEVLGSGSSINTMMNPLKTLVNPISRIDVSSLPSKQINLNVNSQQNFHENSWYSFGGISWQKFPLPFQDTSIIHSEPHRRARAGRSFKANSSSSVQGFFRSAQRNTGIGVSNPWSSMIIHDHPLSNLSMFLWCKHPIKPDLHPPSGGVLFDRIFRSAARHRFGELGIQWAKAKAAE